MAKTVSPSLGRGQDLDPGSPAQDPALDLEGVADTEGKREAAVGVVLEGLAGVPEALAHVLGLVPPEADADGGGLVPHEAEGVAGVGCEVEAGADREPVVGQGEVADPLHGEDADVLAGVAVADDVQAAAGALAGP